VPASTLIDDLDIYDTFWILFLPDKHASYNSSFLPGTPKLESRHMQIVVYQDIEKL